MTVHSALAALLLLTLPVLAHDGAKFEPPDGTVIHGAGQQWQTTFDDYVATIADPALEPYITKRYTGVWDRYPKLWLDGTLTWQQLEKHHFRPLREWLQAQQGLLPEVSVNFEEYQSIFGDTIIPTGALDPVITELARIIRNFDKPVLVRPGYEPDASHYTPGDPYIQSYRRIVDIFRQERVDNAAFIWCAGQAGGLNMAKEDLWFPGDAYVDWIGIDLFSPQSILPSPGSTLPYNASLWTMLQLAEKWKKPVILSETSAIIPGGITDPSPAAAQVYWDSWFGPFFQLVRDNPRIKAFNYIDWNWPVEGWPFWWDARIGNNPTLVQMIRDELSDPRYVHRTTPSKFQRPWLTDLGVETAEGGPVNIRLSNARFGVQGVSFVKFFFSFTKQVAPGTPGYIDDDFGIPIPDMDQFWFLAGVPGSFPVVPVDPDGTFELAFNVPPGYGLAGQTLWFQAVVLDPAQRLHVTQPYEIVVAP